MLTFASVARLLRVLDKAEYSAFESTLNSPIVSYRIVYMYVSGAASNNYPYRTVFAEVERGVNSFTK